MKERDYSRSFSSSSSSSWVNSSFKSDEEIAVNVVRVSDSKWITVAYNDKITVTNTTLIKSSKLIFDVKQIVR